MVTGGAPLPTVGVGLPSGKQTFAREAFGEPEP